MARRRRRRRCAPDCNVLLERSAVLRQPSETFAVPVPRRDPFTAADKWSLISGTRSSAFLRIPGDLRADPQRRRFVEVLPNPQVDDDGVDDDGFADDGVARRSRASRQPNDDGDEHRRRRDRPRRERPTLVAHGEVSIQIDSARRSKRAAMSAVPVWLVDTMPTISRFGPAGTSNITGGPVVDQRELVGGGHTSRGWACSR